MTTSRVLSAHRGLVPVGLKHKEGWGPGWTGRPSTASTLQADRGWRDPDRTLSAGWSSPMKPDSQDLYSGLSGDEGGRATGPSFLQYSTDQ